MVCSFYCYILPLSLNFVLIFLFSIFLFLYLWVYFWYTFVCLRLLCSSSVFYLPPFLWQLFYLYPFYIFLLVGVFLHSVIYCLSALFMLVNHFHHYIYIYIYIYNLPWLTIYYLSFWYNSKYSSTLSYFSIPLAYTLLNFLIFLYLITFYRLPISFFKYHLIIIV